jgi:hypothetical protein
MNLHDIDTIGRKAREVTEATRGLFDAMTGRPASPVQATSEPAQLPPPDPAPASAKQKRTMHRATVQQRLLEHLHVQPESCEWTQRKWAQFLQCSAAAVAQSRAWRTILTAREMAKRERHDRRHG